MSYDHFPHDLSWINDVTNFKYNFQQGIFTLKATLNIWKQRKLSLKGKIMVLNNLALTPIIYDSSVVNTPNKSIEEINNAIQNFIWDGYTSKIAQKTLIQQIDKGCLKLCHFETKAKTLKLSWAKRLTSEKVSAWKILLHMGGVFEGGFGYADDLRLLTLSVLVLLILANICEMYAAINMI